MSALVRGPVSFAKFPRSFRRIRSCSFGVFPVKAVPTTSRDSRQSPIEHIDCKISILRCNSHRRLDTYDVSIESAFANQHADLTYFLEQLKRLGLRWFFR